MSDTSRPSRSSVGLTDLPLEVLTSIALELDRTSILALYCTTKAFKDATETVLWRTIEIRSGPPIPSWDEATNEEQYSDNCFAWLPPMMQKCKAVIGLLRRDPRRVSYVRNIHLYFEIGIPMFENIVQLIDAVKGSLRSLTIIHGPSKFYVTSKGLKRNSLNDMFTQLDGQLVQLKSVQIHLNHRYQLSLSVLLHAAPVLERLSVKSHFPLMPPVEGSAAEECVRISHTPYLPETLCLTALAVDPLKVDAQTLTDILLRSPNLTRLALPEDDGKHLRRDPLEDFLPSLGECCDLTDLELCSTRLARMSAAEIESEGVRRLRVITDDGVGVWTPSKLNGILIPPWKSLERCEMEVPSQETMMVDLFPFPVSPIRRIMQLSRSDLKKLCIDCPRLSVVRFTPRSEFLARKEDGTEDQIDISSNDKNFQGVLISSFTRKEGSDLLLYIRRVLNTEIPPYTGQEGKKEETRTVFMDGQEIPYSVFRAMCEAAGMLEENLKPCRGMPLTEEAWSVLDTWKFEMY